MHPANESRNAYIPDFCVAGHHHRKPRRPRAPSKGDFEHACHQTSGVPESNRRPADTQHCNIFSVDRRQAVRREGGHVEARVNNARRVDRGVAETGDESAVMTSVPQLPGTGSRAPSPPDEAARFTPRLRPVQPTSQMTAKARRIAHHGVARSEGCARRRIRQASVIRPYVWRQAVRSSTRANDRPRRRRGADPDRRLLQAGEHDPATRCGNPVTIHEPLSDSPLNDRHQTNQVHSPERPSVMTSRTPRAHAPRKIHMYNSSNSARCPGVARSSSTWQAAQSQPEIGTGVCSH